MVLRTESTGLYAKAEAGKISQFTGRDSGFEEPGKEAELVLEFICHRECGGRKTELYLEFEKLFATGGLALIFDGLDEAGK